MVLCLMSKKGTSLLSSTEPLSLPTLTPAFPLILTAYSTSEPGRQQAAARQTARHCIASDGSESMAVRFSTMYAAKL